MTIELNVATIIYVCTCIITIGGAVKILIEAKKALEKPLDEVKAQFEKYDAYFTNDKNHLDKLDAIAEENVKSINMLVDIDLTMLRHMSDGNHTGEINQKIKKIEDWLFAGKEYEL